jgi:flagellar motor switch protein FliN/FliY
MTEETQNQPETANPPSNEEILSSLRGFGDIDLRLKVLLGKIKMPIGQYLKITRGSIIELGKSRTEHLDVLVNERKIAEGEIVVTDNEKIGVEITKVHKTKKI